MSLPAARLATVADLLAIPEAARFHEIVGGELIPKAMPSGPHGVAQLGVGGPLRAAYHRRAGDRGPGGWWITSEVDIAFEEHEVYRPDLSGWRRERLPAVPRETPITLRPDWIAEIISPSSASLDRVKKLRVYHRAGVPHYWLVDPAARSLEVLRWTADGYLLVLAAAQGDKVRAEPFGEVELELAELFDDDDA